MSKKIDDDDFDIMDDDEIPEDYEKMETRQSLLKKRSDARRQLEQLLENKALEKMINGEMYDWG